MTTLEISYPHAFADFERTGWEAVAHQYGDCWGHVTSLFVPAMLRAVPSLAGQRLIDVATGPGYAAKLAADLGADATGLDLSASMIAAARRFVPSASFEVADVEHMPFLDDDADIVVSNFGFQHFARPDVALAEISRVLKPNGTLSMTIWAESSCNAAGMILDQAVARHAERPSPVPQGPSYGFLWKDSELRAMFGDSGFDVRTVQSKLVVRPWRLRDADEVFRAELSGSVRSGAQLRCESPAVRQAIRKSMAEHIAENFSEEGFFMVPMAAYVISARAQ